ncbi:MAG: hypothetical protein OSA87_06220 [Woeseiaceae bacterium]|jgi:hypothetical protein|nr:hypothetical protein [Woeseiaceae bacterium]
MAQNRGRPISEKAFDDCVILNKEFFDPAAVLDLDQLDVYGWALS